MKPGKIQQGKRKQGYLFLAVFLLVMPLSHAGLLSVETLSPSSANLCGSYLQNVTVTAQNIRNAGNQTIENVTATLISEPNNGGVSIIGPSLYLGSITPGILSVNPWWQVQCTELPGVYALQVDFSNAEGNLGSSQGEAVSIITVHANDNRPPSILSHSPAGVIPTSYVTMEVVTDEDATCKYSSIPGVAYPNQQNLFQITGGRSHKVPLQNLVDNFYNYYVRCKDLAGNEAQSDYVVSIEINAPPTALLGLSKTSPLSSGTTEVTITTSEPVKPVPSLSYSCAGNSVSVPLTGSGSSWRGYLILSQANANEVCSFSFSSVDLSGNPGSYITGGNLFLIDTLPPSVPIALAAAEQRGLSVKLSWKLPPEEIKNFNIYRRSGESGDFSYYGTTTNNYFSDTSVSLGKSYSYRISAIDAAGNEGPFSEEVSLLMKGIALDEAAVSAENSDKPAAKVKLTLAEIDKTIAAADSLLEEFTVLRTKFKADNRLSDNRLFSVLEQSLEPSGRMKEAKVLLLKRKEELGLLKNEDLADEKVREVFQAIKEEIGKVRHTIISEIKPETEESLVMKVPEEQLSVVIDSYLGKKKPAMSQAEKEEYLLSAKELQPAVAVTATRQNLEITYLDGTKENLVLIRKGGKVKEKGDVKENKAKYSSPVKFYLIEYIPKELASSVDEMVLGKDAEVIDPDPLLGYALPEKGLFNYSYFLKKTADADAAARIVTALVPAVPEITASPALPTAKDEDKGRNFLTGNAVVSAVSLVHKISLYDAGIAAGILSIVLLFIYSLIYSEKEISVKVQHDFPSFDAIKKYLPKRRKKKERMDAAGMATLYSAQEEYQRAGLTPLLDSTLSILLQKTEESLHALDFEKAVKFYHLFCIQNESPSSKKEKAGLSSERIKKKMALLTKHTLLQYAVEKKEFMDIRQVLNEIAELYNELLPEASEKEKVFFQKLKEKHHQYAQQLFHRR